MFGLSGERSAKFGKEILKDAFYFRENISLDCNQYIITEGNGESLALFDAGNGISLNNLEAGMKNFELQFENITKIFITHEHVDHVLGLYLIMEKLKENPPKIYAYTETAKILREGKESKIFPGNLGINASMFGIKIVPLDVIDLQNEEHFNIGERFNFKVYYTPGHSQGSISFYESNNKILIPGDLVFTGGSFGRFDFPGGSLKLLTESIKFVSSLDVKFLLPGHMDVSSNGNLEIQNSLRVVQSIERFY